MGEIDFGGFFLEAFCTCGFRGGAHLVRWVGAHQHHELRAHGPVCVDRAFRVQEDSRRIVFIVDMAIHAFLAVVDVQERAVQLSTDGQFHGAVVLDRPRMGSGAEGCREQQGGEQSVYFRWCHFVLSTICVMSIVFLAMGVDTKSSLRRPLLRQSSTGGRTIIDGRFPDLRGADRPPSRGRSQWPSWRVRIRLQLRGQFRIWRGDCSAAPDSLLPPDIRGTVERSRISVSICRQWAFV